MPSRCGDGFDEEDGIVTTLQPLELAMMGINVWYDSDEETLVNHVNKSGRVYQPIEKDMVKGKEVAKEVTTKESESAIQVEEDSVLKKLMKAQAQVSIWDLLMT